MLPLQLSLQKLFLALLAAVGRRCRGMTLYADHRRNLHADQERPANALVEVRFKPTDPGAGWKRWVLNAHGRGGHRSLAG